MISVIIGGTSDEEELLTRLSLELGRPHLIRANYQEAFVNFCKKAIRSTEVLQLRKGMTEEYTTCIANDNMIVFFPKSYLDGLQIPLIYKLSTVIETAMDMGLNIQAFSFVGEKNWNTHKLEWPSHWPTVAYFTTPT